MAERRRTALVLARHSAAPAAGPGDDAAALAAAALADSYEVLADLVGVQSGIVGDAIPPDLAWPTSPVLPDLPVAALAARLAADTDELVFIPADVPDLPGLVVAKIFKVLHRVDVAVAPERAGRGCAALGLALPLADWIDVEALDLDRDVWSALRRAAPPGRCVRTPEWHRLRSPADLRRLDPGLEGWEETRLLLDPGHVG